MRQNWKSRYCVTGIGGEALHGFVWVGTGVLGRLAWPAGAKIVNTKSRQELAAVGAVGGAESR